MMIARVLVAECKQEVSSFNPVLSHYDNFDISYGKDIVNFHLGGKLEVAGALDVLKVKKVQVVPTYSARARTSTGILATTDWHKIADEFLESLLKAPPVDAAYFAMHGAMASEDEDNPEGFLIAESRKILGENIPIVISLDLHGILTDRMLQNSDAIVAFHTYPHCDFYDTGARAARLLLRIINEEVKPVMARVKIPALVRGDELRTDTGLFGHLIRAAQAIEKSPSGLSAAIFIGNPFTDVPDLRSNSLVVTDNDPERARREAIKMAKGFWQVRERLQAQLTSVEDAISIVNKTSGTIILTDAADAPSSGAPGDSNAILRSLIETGFEGRALIPIVDRPAVEVAKAAGLRGIIRTPIGGTLDQVRIHPFPIEAYVHMLSDGRYISEYSGTPADAGDTAVLQMGGITLVVTSRSVSLTDRSLFIAHGQNPCQFDVVVVKSPHCRYEYFEAWASRVINVDAPGSTSANLLSLGHTKCGRPIFPLDDNISFQPQAQIFCRHR